MAIISPILIGMRTQLYDAETGTICTISKSKSRLS